MCAKFTVTLAKGKEAWTIIVFTCLDQAKLHLQEGPWKGLKSKDKWLGWAPEWAKISLKGVIGELVKKCKSAAGILEWGEVERDFQHSSIHWSPWLSIQGLALESPEPRLKLQDKPTIRV